MSGCGNTTVSDKVARLLKLTPINYTMRSLAKDIGVSFDEVMALRTKDAKLDCLLDLKQSKLASRDGVILASRLAIWLMPKADLRVWLDAPPEIRAKRIAKREGKPYKKVFAETRERDLQDASQYKKLYGIDVGDVSQADILINTRRLDADETAAIIAGAAKALKKRKAVESEAYYKILAAIKRKFGKGKK